MATIATAYVQVMPSMEGATSNITEAIAPQITKSGDDVGAAFGATFASKAGGILKKLAPAAIVGTTAYAVGKEIMDVGKEFDAMTDTIVVGTGASGAALDSLVASAKAIATTVPTSFGDAGDVVQNLNTRLGLVGDALEDVGSRAIEAGSLLGESVNLDTLTGTFNQFGVSADQMADKMDYLFNVGQATGIGFNSLTGIMEKNAPVLKTLGFSFEETANMAGLMDKAGIDASSAIGKLSKVLKESSDAGEPAQEVYSNIIGQLEEYLATGDEIAALDLANEVFGTKGAPQFLDAVKNGSLSLDALRDSALGAGDGIMGTMEKTEDWPEKWQRIKNRAQEALAPLAGKLMDSVSSAFDKLEGFLDKNAGSFEKLGGIISGVASLLGGVLSAALDAVGVLFEWLSPVIGLVSDAVNALGGGFQWLGNNVITPIVNALSVGLDTWANGAIDNFESVGTFFSDLGTNVQNIGYAVMGAFSSIGSSISWWGEQVRGVFTSVTSWIGDSFNGAIDFLQGIPGRIVSFFSGLGSMITNAIGSIHFPTPHVSWETLSVFGMKTPISLPHVYWYAKGGILDSPTIIGAGEAGREAVVPLTQPALAPFAQSVVAEMNTGEIVSLLRQIAAKDGNVYMDSGALVGAISSKMDTALGQRSVMTARGLA